MSAADRSHETPDGLASAIVWIILCARTLGTMKPFHIVDNHTSGKPQAYGR